ncbi:hypothetical protein GSH19_04255 [Lactobacillus sp. S2-2]|uniref:hypothetical protein n=1 Tax=Lactobacillus sp. S2-2 TaxID=2692917 RepID=UPI001F397521|nr:hypothetical protein [Lactobacillus sp. S2-2]MCF6515366.1 hypothetical protein [Lactobacillus sp. S2-2]
MGSENIGKIVFVFGMSLPFTSGYAKLDTIGLIIFSIINLWGIGSCIISAIKIKKEKTY